MAETTSQLSHVIATLKEQHSIDSGIILYVDDGSRDRTWELIERFSAEHDCVAGLKLAHNVGHQQALWAGLEWASAHADAAVSIDADLQDDVNAIYPMVDYYNKGIDIVYGVRKERKTDTFFKKNTALAFYRLMHGLGGEIVYNHADFRLMSRFRRLFPFRSVTCFCAAWFHRWDILPLWCITTVRSGLPANRNTR